MKPVESISKTTIKGQCEFEGSNCNGAEVELLSKQGKSLKKLRLIGVDGFTFQGLSKSEFYSVKVTYSRYGNATGLVENVSTGNILTIKISRP